jgi:diguanylate cyclase (GGDEF)-like protein/PAS domain S-box-containing protein
MSPKINSREAHQLLLDILNAIPDPVLAKDSEGKIVFANQKVTQMYQTSLAQIVGKEDHEFTGDIEMSQAYKKSVADVIEKGKTQKVYEKAIDTNTGDLYHYESLKTPFKDEHGNDFVTIFARDVTHFTSEIDEAEKHRKRLEHILNVSGEGLWDYDVVNSKVYHNHQWELLTGIEKSDNSFIEYQNRILSEDKERVLKAIADLMEHDAVYDIEYRMVRADDDKTIWIWDRGKVVERDESGAPLRLVGLAQDITDKKVNQLKIENLAFYDLLTKLPNRALLEEKLQQELQYAKRHSVFGACLFLDLDFFKQLNDTYGHQVGDDLLIQISNRIKSIVRDSDTVARLGGDEFVVLLHDLDSDAPNAALKAQNLADLISRAITEPIKLETNAGNRIISYSITVSIGIALYGNDNQNSQSILKLADAALYHAKLRGRDNSIIFDPSMEDKIQRKIDIERLIRESIKQEQFYLNYQPQYDHGGNLIGCEALLRLDNEFKANPFELVSIAEESNLILSIGSWVLEQSCMTLKNWHTSRLKRIDLAINVSAKQVWQKDFVENTLRIIEKTGVNPSHIKLEITESVLLKDIEGTLTKFEKLRQCGIKFSLDDFGVGYSSLGYLRNLPFDEIKIDKSFIKGLTDTGSDLAMVKSILFLGESFGIKVVAEGVETIDQLSLLKKLGACVFQGYFFAKPMTDEELEKIELKFNAEP